MIVFGVYDLTNGECFVQSEGIRKKQIGELDLWVLNTPPKDISNVIGEQILNNQPLNIDDMYLALVYDHREKSLFISSDITTSPLNFYYTQKEQKIYFSTSLKYVVKESKIERVLNLDAAKAFLVNGYIVGKETLIQNVYKLEFANDLKLEIGKCTLVPKKHQPQPEKRPGKARKKLIPTIQESILKNAGLESDVFMPLSNGYDSNLILNTVLTNNATRVHAITVGGRNGSDETEAVKQNVENIQALELHTVMIDETYFEFLPDIVWRLDGCVYESGVFLQYALAKKAKEIGATYLLCGEGSDEVQNKYYRGSIRRVFAGEASPDKKYFTYSDPFIGTNLMIMKKSAVMLNSFGIEGRYPFKGTAFSEVAMACSKYNGTGKKLYKKMCNRLFPKEITERIKTRGGTTGVRATISDRAYHRLEALMSQSELLKEVHNSGAGIITDSWTRKRRREQGVQRLLSEIRDEGFAKGMKRIKTNRQGKRYVKVFKEAYLLAFVELFMSGKYDNLFENEGIGIKTSELLFGEVGV